MCSRLRLLLPLLLLSLVASAQRPGLYWSVDFNSVFDNREGDATYSEPQTFFLAQLAPEIGLTLDGGTHRIAAGGVWTQPLTDSFRDASLSPTLYYRYHASGLTFAMGLFSREMLHRPLPSYIWSDSCNYVQRNIRGAMVSNVGRHGFFQAVIDWRGMQSEIRREAFNIIAQGEYRPSPHSRFVAGALAMMNHLARRKHAPAEERVVDNLLYNPYVGIDFSEGPAILDSLAVRVGVLGAMCRDRSFSKWDTPIGLWLDAAATWKWLEVKNSLYAGKALYPYYNKFGTLLDQGEPYYASPWYNRTTLAANLISRSRVSLKASLDFNFARSNFNFYQRLILRIRI